MTTPVLGSPGTRATPKRRVTVDVLFSLQGAKVDYEVGIKALEAADLDFDIAAAIRRWDRRLIGMMGYSLEVPGVDGIPPGGPPRGFTIVVVKGTSDAGGSGGKERFESLLSKYAEQYNRRLLQSGSAADR
jgi:hypothetical protein